MKRLCALIAVAAGLAAAPAHAGSFDCSVVYDEFDSLMNKKFFPPADRMCWLQFLCKATSKNLKPKKLIPILSDQLHY